MKIKTKYKKKLIFNQNISSEHTPIKLKQIETIKEEESNEKTPNNKFINSTNNLLKNFTINKKYNISFLLKSLNKKELSDNITKIFSNRSLSTPQNYNNNNNNNTNSKSCDSNNKNNNNISIIYKNENKMKMKDFFSYTLKNKKNNNNKNNLSLTPNIYEYIEPNGNKTFNYKNYYNKNNNSPNIYNNKSQENVNNNNNDNDIKKYLFKPIKNNIRTKLFNENNPNFYNDEIQFENGDINQNNNNNNTNNNNNINLIFNNGINSNNIYRSNVTGTSINHKRTLSNGCNPKSNSSNNILDKNSNKLNYNDENNNTVTTNYYQINNKYYNNIFNINLSKENLFTINLENLNILHNKVQNLLYKINNCIDCRNEIFEYLNFYFDSKIYNNYLHYIRSIDNKNKIKDYLKLEILCFFIFYDIQVKNNFIKYFVIFKSIFSLLHFNFINFSKFLIKFIKINKNNLYWYENLKNLLKFETNFNKYEDFTEFDLINIIEKNIIDINAYYKLIINDIYLYINSNEIYYKFPFILNNINNNYHHNDKQNIINNFFNDAFFIKNNYEIEDLKIFFNYFILDIENIDSSNYIYTTIFNINNMNLNNNNLNIPFNNKIYTLVLDLDETLIYIKKNPINKNAKILFRPFLYEFLDKMKNLFEIILFSFGNKNYVDKICDLIEKNDNKYFSYRLYRNNAIYTKNKEYIKDLRILNRDIKKIIIVDNIYNTFKLQRENGICIKSFYGDMKDNILNILGDLLEKIRYDCEYTNDIRISLKKYQNEIIKNITI